MMTTSNDAAGAAALENALRAFHEANERLAAILTDGMSQTDPAGRKGWRSHPFNWPKATNASGFEHGLSVARTLVVRRDTARVYVAGCDG